MAPQTRSTRQKATGDKSTADDKGPSIGPTSTQVSKTRGVKRKAKTEAAGNTSNAQKSSKVNPTKKPERNDDESCFWLMKAEPESRIEKGVDVKFSIDDLAAKSEPEPWDGVRNPVAQKNMRNMRKGDLAFFYHSNCKVPGIAGVMKVVREQSTDESAFDPAHPYYDAKSDRDAPRWIVVHVQFVHKFDKYVRLKELQEHRQAGQALATMQVLRLSRLSVSQVTPEEWEFILGLAGEDGDMIRQLAAERT